MFTVQGEKATKGAGGTELLHLIEFFVTGFSTPEAKGLKSQFFY